MTQTTSTTVASSIMSQVLSQMSLAPLRNRFALLGWINASSLDGAGTQVRRIPKRVAIAEANADSEGTEYTSFEPMTFGSSVDLTPLPYAQGVEITTKALRRTMPGATRAEVVQAVMNNSPAAIPMLVQIAVEIIQSHYRKAERTALALLPGLTRTSGLTNTALSIATLIDAQTQLMDQGKPEHRLLAAFVNGKGIGDLRKEINTTASPLMGSGYGNDFLSNLGSAPPAAIAPAYNLLGMPILEVDSALDSTANAGVDKVGGVIAIGRGETASPDPSTLRGFAEFCEGHALAVDMQFSVASDMNIAIGRYEWDVQKHTDDHGVKLIYKAT